jgi:hypothetical protein
MCEFVNDEDLAPIFSRDGRSIRVQVLLSPEEFVKLNEVCEEDDRSHSSYFRQLFIRDVKRLAIEKLSAQALGTDTSQITHLVKLISEMQGIRQ